MANTFFNEYLANEENFSLRTAVAETRDKFDAEVLDEYEFLLDTQVLLYGDVQSGKTSHMMGLIAHCIDNGFRTVLILTSDNTHLVGQTFDRAFDNFIRAEVCKPDDDERFRKNLNRKSAPPAIVVLNKNKTVLNRWKKVLEEADVLTGQSLLIVDDEADAASHNTKINRDEVSTIHGQLDYLRSQSTNCIYLQVTGTPQSIILQSAINGWRPNHVLSFPPGKKYVGGRLFFEELTGNPHTILFASDSPDDERLALRSAILTHLITSALFRIQGHEVCNMLVHPSHLKEVHTNYLDDIERVVQHTLSKLNDDAVLEEIKREFGQLRKTYNGQATLNEVIEMLKEMEGTFNFITVNSESDANEDTWRSGYNFIVGGNSLGRGLTFKKLQTVFYRRESKAPQADTLWQHARMFGYDRHIETLRLFVPGDIAKTFQEVHYGNEAIKRQLQAGKLVEDLRVMLGSDVSPTRSSVVDRSRLSSITGGVNYFAADPEIPDFRSLDEKLLLLLEKDHDHSVNIQAFVSILRRFKTDPADFDVETFVGALEQIVADKPTLQGRIILRKGRKVTQGKGTLLSPDDRKLSDSETSRPILTLYRIEGSLGWSSDPIWVPNIKLPNERVYYRID